MSAVRHGYTDIVDALLAKGANINLQDKVSVIAVLMRKFASCPT